MVRFLSNLKEQEGNEKVSFLWEVLFPIDV